MSKICKCVIPAAGRGTRLKAVAGNVPKELVEVGGKPMIRWVMEEVIAAGLSDICLIISPAKLMLKSYLQNLALAAAVHFLLQEEEGGLGQAIGLARDFAGDEPFALVLPDNLVFSGIPIFRRMFEVFQKHLLSVNALMEVPSAARARGFSCAGKPDLEEMEAGVFRVTRIYPKERGRCFPWEGGKRNYRLYPRMILLPEFFTWLEKMRPPPPAEFDDVPVFQELAARGRLLACLTHAEVFDAGNPEGLRQARTFSGLNSRCFFVG